MRLDPVTTIAVSTMIVSLILVPLFFVILTVVTVGDSAASPTNGFVDPMQEEEPTALSPAVVANVDGNWLRNVKPSAARQYELGYNKFRVSVSSDIFLQTQIKNHQSEYLNI